MTEEITKKEFETKQSYSMRWTNRRRMAWLALISIVVVTLCAFFLVPVAKLKVLGEVITWFYFTMTAIVGAYMGLTTLSSMKENGVTKK